MYKKYFITIRNLNILLFFFLFQYPFEIPDFEFKNVKGVLDNDLET